MTYFCHLCDFMMGLIGKPKLYINFEIAIFSHCINIKGKPQIFESHAHYSSAWNFMMGLGKPQRLAKFEVIGFIYYGNVSEFVFF